MKKQLIISVFALIASSSFAQDNKFQQVFAKADVALYTRSIDIPESDITYSTTSVNLFVDRALTQEEKETLLNSEAFRIKVTWSINEYAKYWYSNDGTSLSADDLQIWRKRYPLFLSVTKGEYIDHNAAQKFINLAKEMTFTLGSSPTVDDIITAIGANKFEQLSGMYFNLVAE